jgi:hypothetical protein
MIRILTTGILAACLAVGLGAAAQQQPTFRGTADNVRVFTTVMDRDGRLVTSLEQKDFEIRDEGKPQPITLFDNRVARRLRQHGGQSAAAPRKYW